MTNKNLIQITLEHDAEREATMVRIDKTMADLLSEKPYSRFDPNFLHPKYDEVGKTIQNYKHGFYVLRDLLANKEVISCDHIRASRGEKITSTGVAYFSVDHIMKTGYDTSELVFITENAYQRLKRSSLKEGDIAIAGSGTGSVGKSFLYNMPFGKAIVGDLFILRPIGVNSSYLYVFLNCYYGKMQISRHESGVSGQTHINKQEIEEFLVPKIPIVVQEHIENELNIVSNYHEKAIQAKLVHHDGEYEDSIKLANLSMENLISRLDKVLTGEKEDI